MMFLVSAGPSILYGNSSTIFNSSQDDSSSYRVKVDLAIGIIFLFISLRLVISKVHVHLIAILYEDPCAHIL